MKFCFLYCFSLLLCVNIFGQIEVGSSTLAEPGDVFVYNIFTIEDDTLSYRLTGENMTWNYEGLVIDTIENELYIDIDTTSLVDSFPDADMLLNGGGFTSAAKINTNSIELLGIVLPEIGFLGIEGVSYFDSPFEYKRVPINYEDSFEDSANLTFAFSTEFIPGLDSIEIPLPGATLDSLRFVVELAKTEEAIGWGELTLDSGSHEVLHIRQVDYFSNVLEVGLNLFETIVWFDASEFLGGGEIGGFGETQTTTYKFLSADSKTSILEFTENRTIDTTGVSSLEVDGRMGSGAVAAALDQFVASDDLHLYPNPSTGRFALEFNDQSLQQDNQPYQLRVLNFQGQVVKEITDYRMSNLLEMPDLPKGSYLLELSDTQVSYLKRLIIIE